MTPDEHAAEAERILTAVGEVAKKAGGFFITADDITANLLRAQVHALLATRPTPPADNRAELTDGWCPDPLHRQPAPTIVDYDAALDRAATALHQAMPPALSARYTLRGVLPWAKAAVDAAGHAPTAGPTPEQKAHQVTIWGMTRVAFVAMVTDELTRGWPDTVAAVGRIADRMYGPTTPTTET